MNPYQDLLERLQTAQSDEDRVWITLQFNLDTQPEAVRKAAQAAAVLHWFDREMLSFVRETPLSEEEFGTLTSLPYVEEFLGRGWNIHEKTRDLLRDKLWREDRPLYHKLSRRAAAWCRKYHSADPVWQTEATYHALLAEERKAEQAFINLGLDYLNHFQYAALEALIRLVSNSVQANRLASRTAAWTWFLQANLDYPFSRYREAKEALLQALGVHSGEQMLTANCIFTLGKVHVSLSESSQARERFHEALPIFHAIEDRLGEANCIHALGEVHARLSELSPARVRYEEARLIYRAIGNRLGEANCIQALGKVHAILTEFPQARGRYEEALLIYHAIGNFLGKANCIQELGDVHATLLEFPQARGRYEEALLIYRANGNRSGEANCIQSLGEVHLRLSELSQARQCYLEALLIYRAIEERRGEANCIMSLGGVTGEEGKQDEALAHFADAMQRFSALGIVAAEASCYGNMGNFYANIRHYPEALSAYNKAIELFHDVNFHINRAEPYMQLGDFSAAQLDLEAAAALNPNNGYLHFNRGRLALWQGQMQMALEYFDQALAQWPEYGEFHLWRALAQALNGAAWEEALQAGLTRTHLARQIKETADALDKLVQTYDAAPLEGLRLALEAALAERTPAILKLPSLS